MHQIVDQSDRISVTHKYQILKYYLTFRNRILKTKKELPIGMGTKCNGPKRKIDWTEVLCFKFFIQFDCNNITNLFFILSLMSFIFYVRSNSFETLHILLALNRFDRVALLIGYHIAHFGSFLCGIISS